MKRRKAHQLRVCLSGLPAIIRRRLEESSRSQRGRTKEAVLGN